MFSVRKVICIINENKSEAKSLVTEAVRLLRAGGVSVFAPSDLVWFNSYSLTDHLAEIRAEQPDLALVFGGDGTMLHSARVLAAFDIPVLGFNLGKLGFLTSVEPERMSDAIAKLLSGNFAEEQRMLLNCEVHRAGYAVEHYTALNDLVLSNVGISRTINIDVAKENDFVFSYRCDAIVVATPNGSTAYSLSAGGPIATPSCELLLLTPVSPHNLYARPMVFDGESTLRLTFRSVDRAASITIDGQIFLEIKQGDYVVIQKNHYKSRFIWIDRPMFFENLRRKMLGCESGN